MCSEPGYYMLNTCKLCEYELYTNLKYFKNTTVFGVVKKKNVNSVSPIHFANVFIWNIKYNLERF